MKWPNVEARAAGFSLVEVCIAIGIIAFAFVAIVGLIPVGLTSAKDAIQATKTSLIAQDVFSRLHDEVTTDTATVTPSGHSLRWNSNFSSISYSIIAGSTSTTTPTAWAYYDSDGCFVDQLGANNNFTRNLYKASIYIKPLAAYPANLQPTQGSTEYPFLAVLIQIGWPAQPLQDGGVIPSSNANPINYTFYLKRP